MGQGRIKSVIYCIIDCIIRDNKMFDRWLDRNERQLQLEKSKIYKEMLDNQILLNQQYRKMQQDKQHTQSNPKKDTSNIKQRQSHQKTKTEEKQIKYDRRRLRLPALQDKQALYEGFSRFIPDGSPACRKKHISRVKEGDDAEEESENEDIEEILSELKSLNKEMLKSKQQLKHKRLSSFGGFTKRNRKERQRKVDIDNNKPTTDVQSIPVDVDPVTSSLNKNRFSPSPVDSFRYRSIAAAKTEADQSISHSHEEKTSLHLGLQSRSDKYSLNTNRGMNQANPQRTGAVDANSQHELEKGRERFIQILKKVKNRGESLFIKLSKFPREVKHE